MAASAGTSVCGSHLTLFSCAALFGACVGGLWQVHRSWGVLAAALDAARVALPAAGPVLSSTDHDAMEQALTARSDLVASAWQDHAQTLVWVEGAPRATATAATAFALDRLSARLGVGVGAGRLTAWVVVRLGVLASGVAVVAIWQAAPDAAEASRAVLSRPLELLAPLATALVGSAVVRHRARVMTRRAERAGQSLVLQLDERYRTVTSEELLARVLSRLANSPYGAPVSPPEGSQ